jgi:hypothetical protein
LSFTKEREEIREAFDEPPKATRMNEATKTSSRPGQNELVFVASFTRDGLLRRPLV